MMSKNRMNELYEKLKEYNFHYHNNNESLISDYEYDQLFDELKRLEQKYPEFKKSGEVTSIVGAQVDAKFSKVSHSVPMLSLDNAFTYEDLIKFDNDIRKQAEKFTYVCEVKIDGLAMAVLYQNNLYQAVTRGDGETGEDVTHNVLTIKSLPKEIGKSIEVRGEVFIDKDNFQAINNENKRLNKKIFANPRNLAAGSIRQLDASVSASRNLDMFIYSGPRFDFESHIETLEYLQQLGFKVNPLTQKVNSIEDVFKYLEKIEKKRHDLKYEIDGVVIKVNEYKIQDDLGFTQRAPKWAIAYKFKAEQVETYIKEITFQVGRTGKITPVAELEPTTVSGSVVSRATLHNEDYIIEKDIRVGDYVMIHKAGEIIPEVIKVVKEKRGNLTEFEMISSCPVCNSTLVKHNEDVNWYCDNYNCTAKITRKLAYFTSIDAMNIEGLGEKVIEQLYDEGFIKDIPSIYQLNSHLNAILKLPGLGEKSIDQLLINIEKSKESKLEQFITGLGIPYVGKKTASLIARHYPSLENLKAATKDQLLEIEEIGPKIAESILQFVESDEFEKIVKLINDMNFQLSAVKIDGDSEYLNKKIVVTGSFANYSRKDIEDFFLQLGATVSSSVSKKTDYIIVGEKAGSKLTKAQELGVTVITEEELNTLMKEGQNEVY